MKKFGFFRNLWISLSLRLEICRYVFLRAEISMTIPHSFELFKMREVFHFNFLHIIFTVHGKHEIKESSLFLIHTLTYFGLYVLTTIVYFSPLMTLDLSVFNSTRKVELLDTLEISVASHSKIGLPPLWKIAMPTAYKSRLVNSR